MKEINRILNEQFDPVFCPCPTCKRPLEIGETCSCWERNHLVSTLDLVELILEEYEVNGPLNRAYRLAEIIKEWREEGGL